MKPTRASMLATLSFALALGGFVAVPGEAQAQIFNKDELKCRQVLAAASRHYMERVLAARIRCQNGVVAGELAPATNCISGRGDAKLDRALRVFELKLSRTVPAGCAGVNLTLLGFPGICTDTTPEPFGTGDLTNCIVEKTEAAMKSLLGVYYPPLDDFYRGNRSTCLRGSALDAFTSFRRDVRARHRCLLGQEIRKVERDVLCRNDIQPYGPGTGSDRVNAEVRRAYLGLLGALPAACTQIEIDQFRFPEVCPDATGGLFTVFDLKACLFDRNRSVVLEVLDIVFPQEPVCGNNRVEAGEECDDGIGGNSDTIPDRCRTDCQNPSCGDDTTDTGEQCDDGNTADGDGCTAECVVEVCGDGIVNNAGAEQCDNGANNSNTIPDACRTNCQNPSCGDGVQDTGEECDDGNKNSNDGCSATCVLEFCGDGVTQAPREECDDGVAGNGNGPDQCRPDCSLPFCGDGVTDSGFDEQCDDGNDDDYDGCTNNCTICGDGVVTAPEDCDGEAGTCGAGEGCSDRCLCELACPGFGELTIFSGVGDPCVDDEDCELGTCDPELGRCRTRTRLDSGWTGSAHNSDINNLVTTRGFLDCQGSGPTCGECNVIGIDPSTRNCRCAGDNRQVCDKPFQPDADNCGGGTCDCYLGPPFPLFSVGTPACVLTRFAENVTGTANVDTGEGALAVKLRTVVYLGILTSDPCPTCGGVCSNNQSQQCVHDSQCGGGGTCMTDPVPNDGIRGGVCVGTAFDTDNPGQSCDVSAFNTSFTALPGVQVNVGYSLDCFPSTGKNISGTGLRIEFTQSTGTAELGFGIPCGGVGSPNCPCRVCSNDGQQACSAHEDCTGGNCSAFQQFACTGNQDCASLDLGTCTIINNTRCSLATNVMCSSNADCQGRPGGTCQLASCSSNGIGTTTVPNQCDQGDVCEDLGDGRGQCSSGPNERFCDGLVKGNGAGILGCFDDDACGPNAVGVDAGRCLITQRRSCFLDPIVAVGEANPETPVGAAVFCVPPTGNGTINSVAGLPGPARVLNHGKARTFCASDRERPYTPGVGGCLEAPSAGLLAVPSIGASGKGRQVH